MGLINLGVAYFVHKLSTCSKIQWKGMEVKKVVGIGGILISFTELYSCFVFLVNSPVLWTGWKPFIFCMFNHWVASKKNKN